MSYGFENHDISSDSDLSDAPEDIGPYPFDSPLLSPTIKNEENSKYEDFKALPEDVGSYSFNSPLPSPLSKSREVSKYEKDFRALQQLLASAKEAFDTSNFSQQVETAAKLDIAMEDFDEKWPGRLPDADVISDSGTDSLYQDLSSSDDDNNDSTLVEYFPCPYGSVYHCTPSFKDESAAIVHSTIHTATSGKYLCPYTKWYECPKTFSTLHGARQHGDSVHLQLRPFPCPYAAEYACSKFFSQPYSAKEHGYTHTGEKPHPCPYAIEYACSKFFSQSHSAREHGYTHTGEKPHPCPHAAVFGCSKAFSQLHSAKEHGYTHKRDERRTHVHTPQSTGALDSFLNVKGGKEYGRTPIEKDDDEDENKKSMLTQLNHSARPWSGSFLTTASGAVLVAD
jgi:hypothetical protein